MKLGEPTKIRNSFPASNEFIKWFTYKFCTWGMRLPHKETRGTFGTPAPLWMNMSEKKYKLCFVINLTSSLIFILFFVIVIVYNASVQSSISNQTTTETSTDSNAEKDKMEADCLNTIQQEMKPQFIIIGSSILFINGTHIF